MSTPTAAGMTAPRVGMTEPTVAPRPRCASGMRARCGNTNGMRAVVRACCSVLSSSIEAQLSSRSVIFSMVSSRFRDGLVDGCRLPSTGVDGRRRVSTVVVTVRDGRTPGLLVVAGRGGREEAVETNAPGRVGTGRRVTSRAYAG